MPERLVREPAGDRPARERPMATGPAPRIQLGDATLDHRPIRPEALAHSRQTELVKPAERREIWGSKGSLMHVEVFQMGSVGTSIIGRPRRLPSHRHAALIHTLNCEEPLTIDQRSLHKSR